MMTPLTNLLALDMSLEACSVALMQGNAISSTTEFAARQQSRHVLAMIKQLLDETGLAFSDLDAVAFGCGPGSFTGVRLAASVAQGIAFTENVALLPVSTMQAIAQAVCRKLNVDLIWVALNAHSEEIYSAIYQNTTDDIVACISPERRCSPKEVSLDAVIIGEKPLVAVGNAWTIHADALSAQLPAQAKVFMDFYPYINEIVKIAEANFNCDRQVFTVPESALPAYSSKDVIWKKSN